MAHLLAADDLELLVDLSSISSCHCDVSGTCARIRQRSTTPRSFSSLSSSPGHNRLAGTRVIGGDMT
jgi:hypothetical protein